MEYFICTALGYLVGTLIGYLMERSLNSEKNIGEQRRDREEFEIYYNKVMKKEKK